MTSATTPAIAKFTLLSLAVHALAFASWSTPSLPKPHVSATLSVGFAAPAVPAKSGAHVSEAQNNSQVAAPRVDEKVAPDPIQPRPLATSAGRRAPAAKQKEKAPPKRSSSLRKPVSPRHAVHPSNVSVAKASVREESAMSAQRSVTNIGTPVASRPWEAVWGSVRSYTPIEALATASTPQLDATTTVPRRPAPANPIEGQAGDWAQAHIRARLETDLSRYFSYPTIARKQGWQGDVSVTFTVQSDGRLTDVRITRSSGYHVLDQSALAALRKVGHLTDAPQWLNGQSITVELPVIYRLEN